MMRPSARSWSLSFLLLGWLLVVSAPAGAQTVDWQAYKGTTIRVMFTTSGTGLATGNLVPDFEKLTGIKVEFEKFPEDQFRQKILLELAAGTGGVDAFFTGTAQEGLKYHRSGWYEPLDSYLKNAKLTDPGYDLPDMGRSLQGNIYDGKVVALPIAQISSMLYYRKDLLEKYKIAVPQTFQELEEAAKKLNNIEDGGQKVAGISLRGKGAAATSQLAGYMFGMGGDWLTKDRKPAINSPEAIKAFDLYGRLHRLYGPAGSVNFTFYEANSVFAQGRAALRTDANLHIFIFEDPTKSQVVGKVGYAPLPAGPAGRHPTMEVWSLAVSAKSKKKEAAYLFTQWAASKETSLKMMLQGVPTPRASAWKDSRFLAKHESHKDWVETSLKNMEIANTTYNPPVMAVSEVRDVIGEVISASILGQDVKAAADKAAIEMWKIMEKTEGK